MSFEVPLDNSQAYQAEHARWYGTEYAWRREDIPFYVRLGGQYAGHGGSVLELGAGEGRVAMPMLEAGFRVTAVDSSADMLASLERRAAQLDEVSRGRLEVVEQDMRRFRLERLFRFIYLPFNTLLVLPQPHERQRMLERVREHLAPSGAFAFDIFTPDPRRLVDDEKWEVDIAEEVDDPGGEGRLHVLREHQRHFDYGRQVMHVDWRLRISRGDVVLSTSDTAMDLCYIFPRELELLLERQGFRVKARYGGPGGEAYLPSLGDMQPQYVVAQLEP
ncbi:MAG: class I SAM-dependent methyltransferase [Candidatus Dormibacteria bacterium]